MSGGNGPAAVLHPADAAEVLEAVRAAAAAGERLAVHRPAPAGARELRLDRLSRILEIHTADLVARVEAGVPLAALAAALAAAGVRFVPAEGPLPAPEGSAGALYARGLGHARTLKYGAAKHFLLGSRLVLPGGAVLATGGRTVKNVTGYDLTRFLNAPFAAFGVAVELTLKLLPLPAARRTLRLRVPPGAAPELARAARDAVLPAYLLWADRAARRLAGAPGDEELVLLELDGEPQEVREAAAAIEALARRAGGAAEPLGGPEAEEAARPFAVSEAVLPDELKVEPGELAAFAASFGAAARDRGLDAGLQGRLAEGVLSLRLPAGSGGAAAALEVAAACGARLTGRWARARGRAAPGPLAELERALVRRLDPGRVLAW